MNGIELCQVFTGDKLNAHLHANIVICDIMNLEQMHLNQDSSIATCVYMTKEISVCEYACYPVTLS